MEFKEGYIRSVCLDCYRQTYETKKLFECVACGDIRVTQNGDDAKKLEEN